jgi:hypothetical protein
LGIPTIATVPICCPYNGAAAAGRGIPALLLLLILIVELWWMDAEQYGGYSRMGLVVATVSNDRILGAYDMVSPET